MKKPCWQSSEKPARCFNCLSANPPTNLTFTCPAGKPYFLPALRANLTYLTVMYIRFTTAILSLSLLLASGLTALSSCSQVMHEADVSWNTYRMADTVAVADSGILTLIAPYREKLEEDMEVVIGQAAQPLTKGSPESTLGNWMADLMMNMSEQYFTEPVDFAIHNQGGLRIPEIPAGPIKVSTIYQLMPFDNVMVMVEMNGERAGQLFERMAEARGWPVSEEVRYQIQEGQPKNIQIRGEPLEENRIYRVAMPDYVANGGDNCDFLRGLPQQSSGKFTRDVIIAYIRQQTTAGQTVEAQLNGRVVSNDR